MLHEVHEFWFEAQWCCVHHPFFTALLVAGLFGTITAAFREVAAARHFREALQARPLQNKPRELR